MTVNTGLTTTPIIEFAAKSSISAARRRAIRASVES